jgi:hypothetical protein
MVEKEAKSKVKYTTDTPASDVIRVLKRLDACSEAVLWFNKYEGKTYGELNDGCADKEYNPGWGIWLLELFGEEIDIKERLKVIDKITDPMSAFSIYIRRPWLTDEEDALLLSKFKGKVPQAEKELRDGIIKRVK